MEGTVRSWLLGVTVLGVAATLVASPYTASIFSSIFGGVAGVYRAARA